MAVNTTRFPLRGMQPRSATARRGAQAVRPSDDEILGLVTSVARPAQNAQADPAQKQALGTRRGEGKPGAQSAASEGPKEALQSLGESGLGGQAANSSAQETSPAESSLTPELAQVLEMHPQLRAAWDTAQEFQSVFATPAAAQDAKSQLDELDGMFFSGDPSAQAALAARIHELSPEAFHSLRQAMQQHTAQVAGQNSAAAPAQASGQLVRVDAGDQSSTNDAATASAGASAAQAQGGFKQNSAEPASEGGPKGHLDGLSHSDAAPRTGNANAVDSQNGAELRSAATRATQLAFFHSTNSAAVQQVLAAIESQMAHLLPASVSAPTKTRIVGEIYRDLSSALGTNRQLGHQLREAFRSGAGDAAHQRAIVALVAGRARQALPSIARRVINEWTHGVVSANQEKLSRQSASAKRVDISGAASSDGVNRRPISPRDVNYKRLSDADILNL